ncbi:MAG TPA: DUF3000 domain-containing protein [Sporichthyaceae bacterium]|jgi:hypothetical protein|nr:DUF3000 domain-containing protein [Sporichthyaceae bacterium]
MAPEVRQFPPEFAAALDGVRAVNVRPELSLMEAPAPAKLAPFAAAVAASVEEAGSELARGRLIVLYDPEGHEAWDGCLRLVTYIRTELEDELVTDPMLPEVAWGWLADSLAEHGVALTAGSGTVTRVQSQGFGELADGAAGEPEGELEIRASWCPVGGVTAHVQAWLDALCTAGGLPPASPGVRALHRRLR